VPDTLVTMSKVALAGRAARRARIRRTKDMA
jgi:hypothetical protein